MSNIETQKKIIEESRYKLILLINQNLPEEIDKSVIKKIDYILYELCRDIVNDILDCSKDGGALNISAVSSYKFYELEAKRNYDEEIINSGIKITLARLDGLIQTKSIISSNNFQDTFKNEINNYSEMLKSKGCHSNFSFESI